MDTKMDPVRSRDQITDTAIGRTVDTEDRMAVRVLAPDPGPEVH